MDYNKEAEKLNSGSDAWKPELGTHTVAILSEAEDAEYVDNETGKITPQIKLVVSLGDKPDDKLNWYIGKGMTTQSLYGQLMLIGQSNGQLIGKKIDLIVNELTDKTGKKRKSYTIGEAIKILALKTKQEEEVK